MQHSTPAAPAVRETLERVLASATFGRSERARALLRYLVERQLAGESDRLKGFAIAVDVFGKDADFDASADTIVRVQAGRLRGLLDQYFTTEGAAEPFRITIPRGSYVPAYETNHAPPCAVPDRPTDPISQARRAHSFPAWGALAALAVLASALIAGQRGFSPPGDIETASIRPALAAGSVAARPSMALPTVYLDVVAKGAVAERIAASLRAGLSGFDSIDFIGRETDGRQDPQAGSTGFVFHVLPEPVSGGVTLELQHMASGRVLMSRDLKAADASPATIDDRIAGILTATVPASGTIYDYIEQNDLQESLTECLILGEKYYLDQNARTHEAAYRCLQDLIGQGTKSPLIYSEIASLHLEAVTKHFPYPADASAEQAMAFARHAIQIGSTSASVHRSYGYLNSRLGKPEAAIRWMRKAYEINPYDLGMAAAYGYSLVFAGRYAEGTPILARAIEAASAHPTWWDFGLFAGKLMLGDTAGASHASDALITTTPRSHYLTARIISAAESGDVTQAKELSATLTREFPEFTADPRKVFLERNYPADLTDRLVKALRDAGITDAG